MLVPLFILGFCALFAGYLFAGSFIGYGQAEFWNGTIFTKADNNILLELTQVPTWVKLSPLVMMVSGFVGAWYFYIRRPDLPPKIAESQILIYKFLLNKWYIDELYDFVFVRPVRWLARVLWKQGDGRIIDGFGPDGVSSSVVRVTANFVKLQSGFVYHYAFVMLLGIAGFISWFMFSGGM
jgi:NADH-quinone oxidoreductase subunit L